MNHNVVGQRTRGPNVASSAPPEAHIRDQDYGVELTELRRHGGKDASAALRAQIGDKPPAEGARTGRIQRDETGPVAADAAVTAFPPRSR